MAASLVHKKKLVSTLQFKKGVKQKEPTFVVVPVIEKDNDMQSYASKILKILLEFNDIIFYAGRE